MGLSWGTGYKASPCTRALWARDPRFVLQGFGIPPVLAAAAGHAADLQLQFLLQPSLALLPFGSSSVAGVMGQRKFSITGSLVAQY